MLLPKGLNLGKRISLLMLILILVPGLYCDQEGPR